MLPFETAAIIISLVIILLFLTVQPAIKLKLDRDDNINTNQIDKPNKPQQMNEVDVIESFAGTLPLGRSMDMPSYTYNLSSASNNWEHTVVNDMYGDEMSNKS